MKKILGVFLIVSACCSQEEQIILRNAQVHAEKLRNHFIGYVSEDVSSLISETRIIAYQLKALRFCKLANKFNSYTDVLMYGNNTLAESVRDMQELINKGVCSCDYRQCIENPFNR